MTTTPIHITLLEVGKPDHHGQPYTDEGARRIASELAAQYPGAIAYAEGRVTYTGPNLPMPIGYVEDTPEGHTYVWFM
jgi:hypothetical protein